jgi:hypothetical protein
MMAAMLKSSVATEFHSNRLKTMPSGMKIRSQPVLLFAESHGRRVEGVLRILQPDLCHGASTPQQRMAVSL